MYSDEIGLKFLLFTYATVRTTITHSWILFKIKIVKLN